MEVFGVILEFFRTDIFISFGLLTIPLLIGRFIPKIKDTVSKIDEAACRFIIFSGIVYTVSILLSYVYLFLVIGDSNNEYAITNRATGPYAWAYWLMMFSWLFITQPFRFKLVRKNILIRLISIPFFLITLEQYIILITSIHRDYLPLKWSDIDLGGILNTVPYWPLHLILKLAIFIGYVFIFHWISKKIKRNKVVS
ncbi:hypothetical protein GCM10011344_43400 [Dokdonia pacifica]|uniref:Uncharacterized protein n=1 Tax=Dokdonia pacifica TaxID=1627892 RepID=A0A239AEP1_9FLAO|nr:hypothetical protein [Dokdonia pacifica]GGG37871.1 hypothetical protein GCM10011344_43400 [Dokdonia pacifica]SNR94116.1 hypothetical protein SAMN06265376_104381 [Dokdonia pacifica]